MLSAGCSDLWNYRCVYSPWMGVDPVVNYAVEKNVIPKPSSMILQITKHQFRTVFKYLTGDEKHARVLESWTQTFEPPTNRGVSDEKKKE